MRERFALGIATDPDAETNVAWDLTGVLRFHRACPLPWRSHTSSICTQRIRLGIILG